MAGYGYEFAAEGKWRVDDYRTAVNADGWPRGEGRLVAAILCNEQGDGSRRGASLRLHRAFQLGRRGSFLAPQSGQLFVRCSDAWTQLDDNQGECKLWLRPLPSKRPE